MNETKRHEEFRAWADRYRDNYRLFSDLPPESFAESGTRVQTVILTLKAPEVRS